MKNKQEVLSNLTKLEKEVILNLISEGFALDDLDNDFMGYGVDGNRERGAFSSLIKKGIFSVCVEGDDHLIYLVNGFTKPEVFTAAGYKV